MGADVTSDEDQSLIEVASAEVVSSADRASWMLSAWLRSISGQMQVLPIGARARLRRMDPESPGREVGDVVALLLAAGMPPDQWQDRQGTRRSRDAADERLVRWARICHLIATLAGASGRETHAPVREREQGRPQGPFRVERLAGSALVASDYSEHRLMRLTSARGPALADQVRRLARFLAAAGTLPVDLTPIAELILCDGLDERRADAARLEIARSYYAAQHRTEKTKTGAQRRS